MMMLRTVFVSSLVAFAAAPTWAQTIEDEDLLKDRTRKSVETKTSDTDFTKDEDLSIKAPLVIPNFHSSLNTSLMLPTGQRIKVSPGEIEAPAGMLRVISTRTNPGGFEKTTEYNFELTTSGGFLPLPRMIDVYAAGAYQTSWFQAAPDDPPPADIKVKNPSGNGSLPGTTSGIFPPSGAVIKVDVPSNLPAFAAHDVWRESNAKLQQSRMWSLLAYAGSAGLLAAGGLAANQAVQAKLEASAINDPSRGDYFEELSEYQKSKQSSSVAFFVAGSAALAGGLAINFVVSSKQAQKTKAHKKELDALLPIQLSNFMNENGE